MLKPSKKELFGAVRLDELTAHLGAGPAAAPPVAADDQRLVPFSVRLRFVTLLRLKQALHHLGGQEQAFVDAALSATLDGLPEAERPLPAATLAQLRRKAAAQGR